MLVLLGVGVQPFLEQGQGLLGGLADVGRCAALFVPFQQAGQRGMRPEVRIVERVADVDAAAIEAGAD